MNTSVRFYTRCRMIFHYYSTLSPHFLQGNLKSLDISSRKYLAQIPNHCLLKLPNWHYLVSKKSSPPNSAGK